MSRNESHDIDLRKYESSCLLTEEDQDNLDEFVGQLQESFSFANNAELNEQLIFIAIEKTFKEYFDGVDIKIKSNYGEKLRKLRIGA